MITGSSVSPPERRSFSRRRSRSQDPGTCIPVFGLPVGAAVVSCQGYASDPTVAVGPGSATSSAFGFAEIHPNPTSIALAVTIRLPASTPARLMAFDLQGRRLASRNLRFARAGSYTLQLEEAGTFPPGFYTVRLEQAGRSATTT